MTNFFVREEWLFLADLAAMYASADIPKGSMRVGPNTDAVVWKVCDSSHEAVEL